MIMLLKHDVAHVSKAAFNKKLPAELKLYVWSIYRKLNLV